MDSKVCNSCSRQKPLDEFAKVASNKSGYGAICKVCKNLQQKAYRVGNGDSHTKSYEKTPRGYLVRTYRNMSSRVTGILKHKQHLYEGLSILGKDAFYEWSLSKDSGFIELLDSYAASGYDMKLAPSIDRKDSTLGYEASNIRWITHSENSRLGAMSRHYGKR